MEKLFYSIGEVADVLGESVSLVRFWSETFGKFLAGKRNTRGQRIYTEQDLETFKQIHFLVKDCGLTLEGAAKKLFGDKDQVSKVTKAVEKLRGMRDQLVEIRKSL